MNHYAYESYYIWGYRARVYYVHRVSGADRLWVAQFLAGPKTAHFRLSLAGLPMGFKAQGFTGGFRI